MILPNTTQSFIGLVFLVLTLVGGFGCSTEIDLNAEPKDIWVVYGILRHDAEVQDIRIAKAFLIAGDALEFAKENDQSEKGLTVTLTDSRGREWNAREVDSVALNPQDGTFFPYTTVYRFDTPEDRPLVAGGRYKLRITQAGDETFEIEGETSVPLLPTFARPGIVACPGNTFRLTPLQLHNRYDVSWGRGRSEIGAGLGFELRAYWNYEKNGEAQDEIVWGPTSLITEGSGCQASGSQLCHRIPEGELLNFLLFNMNQEDGARYTFESTTDCLSAADLSTALTFEVTAADTALTNYMRVNDPRFTDFNTVRLEYTNLTSSATVLGIFGSTSKARRAANLDQCSAYLLNLNNTPRPTSANCEL
ncbi:MAG: hypothetical protein AB8F95_08855 [Bacteroidia bacterium]